MSILREIITGLLILIFLGAVAIGVIIFVTNTQLKSTALTPNENATSENKRVQSVKTENKRVQYVESPTYHTLTIVCRGHEIPIGDFATIVPSPGKHSYVENENVIVKAEFKKICENCENWNIYITFDGWSGDATGTMTEITVVMDSDKTIKADFSWGYLGENDYALSGYKLKDLPVSYLVNPENPRGIDENRVTAAIKRAFEYWDRHTSTELFDSNVKTTEISHHKNDGLNVVFFDNNIDFAGLAYRWPHGDELVEFDIVLNPKILRSNDTFFKTTLHEVGHALGLGHPERNGTLMSSLYDTNDGKNFLAPGDIMGLHVLYGDNVKRG